MTNNQKKFSFTNVIIAVCIIVSIFIVGFVIYARNDFPPSNTPVNFTASEISDWKTYTNNQYGFELKYPSFWIVKEDKEDTQLGSNIKNIFFEAITKDKAWIKDNQGEDKSIVFGIKVYTSEQYDNDKKQCTQALKENYEPSDCLRMLIVLDKNSNYVFVYYSPAGAGLNPYPSDFNPLFLVGNDSSKTFKFTESVSASKTSQVNGKIINFEGEVRKGEIFQQDLGKNLVFKLTPDNDGGWEISILNPKYPDHNYSMFNLPLRFANVRIIGNGYSRTVMDELPGSEHNFYFVLNENEYKKGFDAMSTMLWPYTYTEKEQNDAENIFFNLKVATAKLAIESSKIDPPKGNKLGEITHMKFKVEIDYKLSKIKL